MSFSGSTVNFTVIPVWAVKFAAVKPCNSTICGLLTIKTLMVVPAFDLSRNGSDFTAPPPPAPALEAPIEAEPAGAELEAEPAGADAEAEPAGADAEAEPAGADAEDEPAGADAAELPPPAAEADDDGVDDADDAAPVELLLHAAVTSIAAQPAETAALRVQCIWNVPSVWVLLGA